MQQCSDDSFFFEMCENQRFQFTLLEFGVTSLSTSGTLGTLI